MEYEKLYKEALERAKQGLPIVEVFPELKDSEDERIRKLFVWQVHRNIEDETNDLAQSVYDGIKGHDPDLEESIEDWKKCLAYLEKQKEQKPNTEETELNSIAFLEQMGYTCIPPGKQQSAEWSEDYRGEDLRTRFAFYTYKDEDDALYLSNVFVEETSRNKGFGTKILAAAEKVAETIGAINIRLKVKQNSPANAWYRKHGYGYMAFEGDYDWLEKTLEYMKPKQEQPEVDLEGEVEFYCINKKVKMTIQELINYYIDTECAETAIECGF